VIGWCDGFDRDAEEEGSGSMVSGEGAMSDDALSQLCLDEDVTE
jgi:hypothetical protein